MMSMTSAIRHRAIQALNGTALAKTYGGLHGVDPEYRDMLHHPKAERQFHNDIEAMEAYTCVLVYCHVAEVLILKQVGLLVKGKITIAYIPERQEPELMYKLFSGVCCSWGGGGGRRGGKGGEKTEERDRNPKIENI